MFNILFREQDKYMQDLDQAEDAQIAARNRREVKQRNSYPYLL